jgi:outer membrane receptor for ferrienterochelin and colicin
MGYQGRDRAGSGPFLLTREVIERRNPVRLTDVIAIVPGTRVVGQAGIGRTVLLRGGCRPTVVIDGVKMGGFQGIDMMVRPGDTEFVRVYHGAELPVQYGLNACGGILIETRRGEPRGEGDETSGGIWRYVVGFGLTLFSIFFVVM